MNPNELSRRSMLGMLGAGPAALGMMATSSQAEEPDRDPSPETGAHVAIDRLVGDVEPPAGEVIEIPGQDHIGNNIQNGLHREVVERRELQARRRG